MTPLQGALVLALPLFLVGCATVPQQVPAYPARGQTVEQARVDAMECEAFAKASAAEVSDGALTGAGVGAVIGGVFGGAVGAVLYALVGLSPGEGAMAGAALGGLSGAAYGAVGGAGSANHQQRGGYAACMSVRGYAVAP